jgi:leucyl-tRNA synthetase
VAPETICEQYGADTARCYILFIGPPEAEAEWQDDGVSGVHRFLHRLWRLTVPRAGLWLPSWRETLAAGTVDESQTAVRRKLHQTLEKVTADIERFAFNTALAAMMELVNVAGPYAEARLGDEAGEMDRAVYSELAEHLALMLSPFAPHLADEIWDLTGHVGSAYEASWPAFDAAVARRARVTVVVQINGKVRDKLEVDADADEAAVKALALASERIAAQLGGREPRKWVYVPGRLLSIVV